MRFDRLSGADGLSFSLVTSILQDQQGFMWFGTRYGLNKYDGFNFTVYLPESEGDIMSGNYILGLYQDRTGGLWMTTLTGLARLDSQTGKFIHYRYNAADPHSLTPGDINTICEDSSGTLWIGTNGGLSRYDRSTDTFTRIIQDQPVFKIYIDHRGEVWLGTASGLWNYAPGMLDQRETAYYQHNPSDPASLSSNLVIEIYEDRQGAIWVGTADRGLNRLDRSSGQFTGYQFNPDDPYSLSNDFVSAIQEDDTGQLWIGTNNGLNLLDQAAGHFYNYHFNPDDSSSLINNVVNDLYLDRSGVMWIATPGGICKMNETASSFTHYRQYAIWPISQAEPSAANPLALSDNMVEAIFEDSHGILWIGTVLGGLNRLDRSTGAVTVYRHDPADPTSLSANEVSAIYEDQAGTLWVGTVNGLDRFHPQTGTFESERSLRGRVVSSIFEDRQGNLWIGYWGGVMRRDQGGLSFRDFSVAENFLFGDRVQSIFQDRTGAVWFSTLNIGLFRLDPATAADETGAPGEPEPKPIHFPQGTNDSRSPGAGSVMSFYEDAAGTLWLGSVEDGLIRFDRDSQTFRHYFPNTGFSKFVSCVRGDAQGFLWVGTQQGLARFDPRSEKFLSFDRRDGLEIGEVMSCFQDKQGEMYFGGMVGLNTFFPDQIQDNPNPPAVVITALNLRSQALRTDLPANAQITLSYQENYLSFDFAALDYTAPAKNQYAYKMEGLDADWVAAGARRHADYPDLKPGTYTFRVKASNNSGVWNEAGTAVRITIASPFWQTWWFVGLLGLALAGVIAGGVRLRLKDVEGRSSELERQVGERTGALEQKTLELQQRTLEIEQRRQELEALLSADDRMQRYLRQDQVLQALVDVAVDILRANKSAVIMWDATHEKLSFRVARGFSPQAIGQLQFAAGEGIVGGVALRGEPVLVEDGMADPRRSLEDPLKVRIALEEGIRSFMFLPIAVGEEILGVFNVSFDKPHAAGAEELRLFQALVQRAALQIENARLYEQSRELAVVEERSRLARELHDAVTQTLFSASLIAEALPATWEKDPRAGRGLLQELRALSRGALAEMRTLLLELRPAALVETRLDDLLRQLGEAASGREDIPVNVTLEGEGTLPPEVHVAMYRIAQEALNNVVKHARASQVNIRLCYPRADPGEVRQAHGPRVLLTICDNGRGFEVSQVPHNRLGLGIMQERADAIGARLSIDSRPGEGTQVRVMWEQGGRDKDE